MDHLQSTSDAWDITAKIYWRDLDRDVEALRNKETSLLEPEQRALKQLELQSATAVHLQCAGGTDTLSLHLHGCNRTIGIDISPQMIKVADAKSQALGWDAEWICDEVTSPQPTISGTADLVYTGRGALPWVSNLNAWAKSVAEILKPKGFLLVHEGHPLDWAWDNEASDYQLSSVRNGYFNRDLACDRWPNPYIESLAEATDRPKAYEQQWTLAEILSTPIQHGLRLVSIKEHSQPFWNLYPNMNQDKLNALPHSFTAVWQLE